jgi:mono/diheme cytochrome c family protein
VVALLIVGAFGMMGAGEYLREFVRKPWVVDQVVYANDMLATQIAPSQSEGFNHTSGFLLTDNTNSTAYGANLFQAECGSCHQVHGYRSMTSRVDGWDADFAADILQHLPMMHGVMPPFAGNEADRKALGSYLASLNPPWHFTVTDANRAEIGEKVFASRCAHCHTINGKFRPLRGIFEKMTPSQVHDMFPVLGSMSPDMPNFNAPEDQAQALAFYIAQEANRPLPVKTAAVPMPTTQSQLMRPQEVR